MRKTRKISKKRIFWRWFPLFFNICLLVLAIINIFTDSELLKLIGMAMLYIAPWLLFIQATLDAHEHFNDWLREAKRVCNYMIANDRTLIMLNNIDDEKIRERLIKEYGSILNECILEDEVDDTSEL